MDSPVRELPAEEPEVLSTSVTDGIVEFGPITSSTTFASLKQQESTTTTDTSDFHTTLEEHSKHETQMMMTSNTISAVGKEELSSDFETSSDSDLGEQDPFKKNHPSEHAVLHTENDNSANATTTINTTLPTVTFTTRNVEESSSHHASKQDEDLIPQVSLLNSSSATTNDHKSQPLENSVLKRDLDDQHSSNTHIKAELYDDVKIEPTTTTTASTTKTESPLTPNESSSSSNITIQTREQNSPNEPLLDSNVNSSVTTKVIPKKVIRNKTMIKNSSSVVNVIRGNEDMDRSSATSSPSSPSSSPQQQKLFIPSTNRDRRKTVNFKEIEKEEIEFHPNRATLFMALPPTMTTTTTTNNQTTKQIETYDDDVPYEDEVVNDNNNNNTMVPSTNESSSTTTTVLMTDHPSTNPSLDPVIEQQELSSDEEDDSILNSLLNEESEISTTTKITPSNNTRDTSTDDEDLDKLLASYTKQRKVTLPPKSTNHTALSPVQPSKSTSLKTLPVVDVKSTQRRNSSVNRSNTNNGSKSIPVENNSRRRPSRMVTSVEDLLNEEEDDSSNE
ncbi:hypothetical protein C9374_000913 [Naegleria lovaniensis]|uniref:Uncharacterized protein n=1 Tax=Naegleria lovaniensis TaxID=51637 RepID=A0AA88GYM8_NAELO|nr:uncharacterized protein C9374_000913 [Naegleria lovaniensis]KAG2388063.1 hypothetical protein C9374_000913 [Naegleria lovaniensis]